MPTRAQKVSALLGELESEFSVDRMSALCNELESDNKVIVKIMLLQFSQLRQEFSDSLSSKNELISGLESKVSHLEGTVKRMEQLLDDGDAYERRDTIILSGNQLPAVSSGEIVPNIVGDLVNKHLSLNIPVSEINTAHRLGTRKANQAVDRRPIIVKLCRRDTKKSVLIAARQQPSNAPKLFVNESLTPKRGTILFALRQMKKMADSGVKGCTSQDGRIFAFTAPVAGTNRDRKHLISSHDDLVAFCRDFVKKPLDSFLSEWNH